MEILNDDEFEQFVDNNKKLESLFESTLSQDEKEITANVAINLYRFWHANAIVGLTEKPHESIAFEEKNLTDFLKTINSFFGDGEDAITKKELKWSDGNLVFQSKYLMFWKLWTKSKHRFGVLFRRYNKSLLYTIMLYNP